MRAPDFWRHDGVIPTLLSPVSALWQWRATRRIAGATPARADIPVVCIGNVVAGGAGKTPVALSVAKYLQRMKASPHFLTRGYGGTVTGPIRVDPSQHDAERVGDEPLLLARTAPTWVARDRVAGAHSAVAAGASVLVMDDGFQNPALYKDFSILVVDGGYGFGNRRVMPSGPLREKVSAALERADAVVIVGTDLHGIEKEVTERKPVLSARFVPSIDTDDISGEPVVAFAGIGRPEKFFETLEGMGCTLVTAKGFPDHHAYTGDEVMKLVDRAASAEAIVVTTEKDAVRLPEEARDMVRTLRVTLEWRDEGALDRLLSPILGAKG